MGATGLVQGRVGAGGGGGCNSGGAGFPQARKRDASQRRPFCQRLQTRGGRRSRRHRTSIAADAPSSPSPMGGLLAIGRQPLNSSSRRRSGSVQVTACAEHFDASTVASSKDLLSFDSESKRHPVHVSRYGGVRNCDGTHCQPHQDVVCHRHLKGTDRPPAQASLCAQRVLHTARPVATLACRRG